MKKRKLKLQVKIFLGCLSILLIGCLSFIFMQPKKENDTPPQKEEIKTIKDMDGYLEANQERYDQYKQEHADLSDQDIVTLVNMNKDYAFYDIEVKQENPNALDTIVNKYYTLDLNYAPDDLVKINTASLRYGGEYKNHQARQVMYDDFQKLVSLCKEKDISLYVASGYRSTSWQTEIYNHMVEVYDQKRADETCSRPGHSEHTTGLGIDVTLDDLHYNEIDTHPQYQWFLSQLSDCGFIIRYPEGKEEMTGYNYEPWHLRYLGKDLAKKVEASGLCYDEYYARYLCK